VWWVGLFDNNYLSAFSCRTFRDPVFHLDTEENKSCKERKEKGKPKAITGISGIRGTERVMLSFNFRN